MDWMQVASSAKVDQGPHASDKGSCYVAAWESLDTKTFLVSFLYSMMFTIVLRTH